MDRFETNRSSSFFVTVAGKVRSGRLRDWQRTAKRLTVFVQVVSLDAGVNVATPLRYKLFLKGAQRIWRVQRGVTLGAQAMVIDDRSRVLLVRHGYQDGWRFPGGGVERSESAETAVCRELREETGVAIEGRPEFFGLFTNFRAFPSDHIALFVVRNFRQMQEPPLGWEIRERAYFPVEALPDDAIEAVSRRLAELKSGAPTATEW